MGVAETRELRVVSAGAARELLTRIEQDFEDRYGATLTATFGPVGIVTELVTGGAPVDLVISSERGLGELASQALVRPESMATIGAVPTALAIREGAPLPDVSDGRSLARILASSDAVFCADLDRSTAGLHVRSVLDQLGMASEVEPRLRVSPHGAAAMRAMAVSTYTSPVGIAQLTEILATDGVSPVGALPDPYDLATVYQAAVATSADDLVLATSFIEVISGAERQHLRHALGFSGPGEIGADG